MGKLPVESLVRQKLCYPFKAKIYCFQVLEMRKVPTQSIEKRGRETRETSHQGFSREPRDREKEKERRETSKILKKKEMKWEQGGEESVMEEEKVRRLQIFYWDL